jgi:glycosyltransferase involved in cell wall biosynthesis
MHGRRWLLKPLSMIPIRDWQALTLPSNPVSWSMKRAVDHCTEKYDAVHATAFPYAWPIYCARRLARRLDVPFLLTPFLHLGDPSDARDRTRRSYTQPALRGLLRSADAVFAQTEMECEAIRGLGIRPERIILQGLGVDSAECTGGNRRAARAVLGISEQECVVGHLANNSIEKGSVDLVRAAELLWRKGIRFRLMLAGPEMPNFRRFIATCSSGDRLLRLGPISEVAKRDFFAAIDLFVLPSRSDSFGLVLLEAWANGIANIVYRAGGPAELVRHGIDGLQAACGNIEELANQMGMLIRDHTLRTKLGEAGWQRAADEFRWADKLELVCAVMEKMNDARRLGRPPSVAA